MRRLVVVVVSLVLVAATAACRGEEVVETWRSRTPYRSRVVTAEMVAPNAAHAVDPRASSFWWIEGANVVRLARDGTLLSRSPALHAPCGLAVDPGNGSCWVLQQFSDELLHFAADGTLLSATPGHPGDEGDTRLTPSPSDGAVWVTGANYLARVDVTGEETSRYSLAASYPLPSVVDSNDGSAWIASSSWIPAREMVARLGSDGSETWRVTGLLSPVAMDEDPRDQSVWVAGYRGDQYTLEGILTHLAADGAVLSQVDIGREVLRLFVSPSDGSVWVHRNSDPFGDGSLDVVHLDSSGTQLWQRSAWLLCHNDLDGSVWLKSGDSFVHYSANHGLLHSFSFSYGDVLRAHDPTDNSLWVTSIQPDSFRHRAADGMVLWEEHLLRLKKLIGTSLDRRDGSWWVLDENTDEFVCLSPEGVELERRQLPRGSLHHPSMLSISPFDGSWWLRASETVDGNTVSVGIRLLENGKELSWGEVTSISAISEADGSIWSVVGGGTGEHWFDPVWGAVRRYGPDGDLLWESDRFPCYLGSVAPAPDGSAWVDGCGELLRFSAEGQLISQITLDEDIRRLYDIAVLAYDGSIHGVGGPAPSGLGSLPSGCASRIASDGTVMWKRSGFAIPYYVAVDPRNGSAWVLDLGDAVGDYYYSPGTIIRLGADGAELWRGDTFNIDWPRKFELDPRDGSLWLCDDLNGQIVHLAVVGAGQVGFPDVPPDHWAYHEIEACVDQRIVFGYLDGLYHPEIEVTRDQMAVYIARALVSPSGDAGIPDPGPPPTFTDVLPDFWAYKQIEYAVSQNVVEGYEDGTYQPSLVVDRGQMAVYVARAIVAPAGDAAIADPEPPYTFPDVPGDDNPWAWCHKHVEFLAGRGVVTGYPDGLYHPESAVSRDQMAVYIARAFGLL